MNQPPTEPDETFYNLGEVMRQGFEYHQRAMRHNVAMHLIGKRITGYFLWIEETSGGRRMFQGNRTFIVKDVRYSPGSAHELQFQPFDDTGWYSVYSKVPIKIHPNPAPAQPLVLEELPPTDEPD